MDQFVGVWIAVNAVAVPVLLSLLALRFIEGDDE